MGPTNILILHQAVHHILQQNCAHVYVQPKWLTEPKSMSLSWPGPHIEWHIIVGRTL